jgi:hypothetical protein
MQDGPLGLTCVNRTFEKIDHAVYEHMWGQSVTITGMLRDYERATG